MKRIIIFFLSCIVIFVACFLSKINNSQNNLSLQVVVDISGRDTVMIPNPENTEKNKMIILHDPELSKNNKNLCMADLSFLGFQEKVRVVSFAVGSVTSIQPSYFHIKYDFPEKLKNTAKMTGVSDKVVQGSCLVMCVSSKPVLGGVADENYIVVLDYANKKYYMVNTVLSDAWTHFPEIHLTDLTGDGMDEIIVSNATNGHRAGTTCEIFRFDESRLKSIYDNTENCKDSPSPFSAHLDDNYKVVVESKTLGYKKSISLINAGYTTDDLEISSAPKRGIYDETQFCRCYKNKKVQNKRLLIDAYVTPLDYENGIQFYTHSNMKNGMRFMYRIYMGKWNFVGKAYAYMNYNSDKDLIEITSVSIENKNI